MSTSGPVPGTSPYGQQPSMPPQAPVPPQQQPPVPPPGYGYPQQGYGYQQQQPMSPQQGYGYQQQFPGAPVPAAPPRKKNTGLIVLLVVALVVLGGAGGGAWYLLAGSSTEPLWSVSAKTEWGGSSEQEVDGTWFTDKAVVQTLAGGVKAYDRATGKKLWATPLPGAGNQACVAPSVSDGGIGIVAYGASGVGGAHGKCDHVAAFDLGTGKELWHKRFKVKDEFGSGTKLAVARTGEAVVVRTDLEQVALKASDGSKAWDVKKAAPKGCYPGTYTGGRNLIRLNACNGGDAFSGEKWTEASLIDPATGKARWTKRFGEAEAEIVLSSSPIVISAVGQGVDVFALDEKSGELRSKLPKITEKYYALADDNGSPMRQAAGFGNIFLLGTSERNGEGEARTLVAYDLDTGKELWKAPASDPIQYMPLRETGGERLLVYVTEATKEPKLVEFDRKSGAMTTVAEYPEEVDKNLGVGAWPFWHKDRIYVTTVGSSMSDTSYSLVALPTVK
ncbi:PQQ-binding-like beta-propeller repeat protein [Streptomyces sp. V1I6]|uniref:outer membrane protein assembly factor BamB family protein n=1 Tax=Streptomyces sp. V1I6 TaxID=3042273 RepID=UPI00278608F3|nr:PQQ-binding-like beta-propeller repeat protein [Streptomyces sp. V1I6]MDQ0846304.1 outer membrane protein assembly factor BamB [Streptomyces sp. V1I6]